MRDRGGKVSDKLSPGLDFAKEFKRFIDTMNAEAVNEQTPLVRRLAAHLDGDPSTMPVVAEEFEHRARWPELGVRGQLPARAGVSRHSPLTTVGECLGEVAVELGR
jgi:hypothetical protein